VLAITRSPQRAAALRQRGLHPIVADVTRPTTLVELNQLSIDTVLFAVGFDRTSGHSIDEVYVDGLATLLTQLPDSVSRFVYISSTGVYGSSDSEVWTEESPCQPSREGGKACLAAERLLAADPLGQRSIILRLAGIYGPGRVPRPAALLDGTAKLAALGSYLNLIHIDDAVQCVMAAEQQPQLPTTYIVSDGHPVRRRDYYREVLRLANLEPDMIEQMPISAISRGSKRVSNQKLRLELDVDLRFPNYRDGLAQATAAFESDRAK
jgi:nucleoside-diphosphate-sugar epimerase